MLIRSRAGVERIVANYVRTALLCQLWRFAWAYCAGGCFLPECFACGRFFVSRVGSLMKTLGMSRGNRCVWFVFWKKSDGLNSIFVLAFCCFFKECSLSCAFVDVGVVRWTELEIFLCKLCCSLEFLHFFCVFIAVGKKVEDDSRSERQTTLFYDSLTTATSLLSSLYYINVVCLCCFVS